MFRVVVDANVFVSALCFPESVPRRALDRARAEGQLLISLAVLHELNDVLSRPKLDRYITIEERIRFLVTLASEAELIATTSEVTTCRDPKDNHILELAIDGTSSHIVSGDRDLLVLDPFRGVRLLSPLAFLNTTL